jgi:GMP synthase-like glutamine amidotransferase
MKILVIQHSAGDSPAAASEMLERLGDQVQTIRIDKGDAIPDSVDADVLMAFGGAISLTDPILPPWVAREQTLIRDYVDQGRRVLGICLGSQMVARALGAKVRRNAEPEIGWHTIERVAAAESPLVADVFADRMTVLQWHQDTFDIPAGATQLFRSGACENQGFTIEDRVFAFQFHMEASPRTVDLFLAASDLWRRQRPFVQSRPEITRGKTLYLPQQTETLRKFLERFLE